MVFGWWRQRRRQRLLAERVPREYDGWLAEDVPLSGRLTAKERGQLIDIARVLMAEKKWYGRGGLAMTERIKLCIAAQAALLILYLDHDHYRRVETIFVEPATYQMPQRDGAIERGVAALGHTSAYGPIVLAWNATRGGAQVVNDGRNVVLHEFAHKLDLLDHYADGTPPLGNRARFDDWVAVMSEHFTELVEKVEAGRRGALRDYAAQNPAEFFAVATEAFFEKADVMKRRLPELYDVLKDFYQQDPARWPRA